MTETSDPAALRADSLGVSELRPSPNHGERRGRWAAGGPDLLLLHYTGMPAGRGMSGAERAIRWLTMAEAEVSAHYVVAEDGRVTQLVAEERRAWHAGLASWSGEADVNSASIGIEIVNPGHWWDLGDMPDRDPDDPVEVHPGYADFPEAQIAAVIALGRDIVARHGIPTDRVLGHSDVAPGRKRDPGEKFPWARLAAAGLGTWVEPAAPGMHGVTPFVVGERSPRVSALRARLALWGYGIEAGDLYDAATRTVVEAFQRHYMPGRIDGIADLATLDVLHRLIDRRRRGEAVA